MRQVILCAVVALAVSLGSISAFAQGTPPAGQPIVIDLVGVTITPPAGWEDFKVSGNDKSLAAFRHAESQSQIEVIATKLVNADVAQIYFDTFAQTLVGAQFQEVVPATELVFGTLNAKQVEYQYDAGVTQVRVVVVSFLNKDVAYLVVGYFGVKERDLYYDALKTTIEKLKFS